MAIHLVRKAEEGDIDVLSRIEQKCFPADEAATKVQIAKRIKYFGNHFYVIEYAGDIVGFINGMVTDEESISDEMYDNTSLHNEYGKWQTVFGLDIISEFRKRGFATILMNEMIKNSRSENRYGLILTCKKNLITFYEKFGFQNQGISKSVHGGAVWYDMRLFF